MEKPNFVMCVYFIRICLIYVYRHSSTKWRRRRWLDFGYISTIPLYVWSSFLGTGTQIVCFYHFSDIVSFLYATKDCHFKLGGEYENWEHESNGINDKYNVCIILISIYLAYLPINRIIRSLETSMLIISCISLDIWCNAIILNGLDIQRNEKKWNEMKMFVGCISMWPTKSYNYCYS